MATERVLLEVDADTRKLKASFVSASKTVKDFGTTSEKSGDKAAKGFQKAGRAANDLGIGIRGVRNVLASAFVVTGLAGLATSIVTTADAVREMDAKMKVATVTQQQFNTAQEETKKLADRTFSAIEDTVDLYAKLSLSLRDTNIAQNDVLRVTETISKAFTVSGANAQEASNAIRQLAQSMSAGVLRGDEFRSVMEQGTRVATILTDSLGVTRGELKAMADTGELSAQRVIDALLDQSKIIDEEFSRFPVTVSRSIILMSNAWTNYISQSETAAEVSKSVSEVIQFAANNLEALIDVALVLTQVLVSLAGAKVLGALIVRFKASSVASAAAAAAYAGTGNAAAGAAAKVGLLTKASKGLFGFLKSNALGIAIFGGIELLGFIGELIEGMESIPTAVDKVDAAFEEGFSVEALQLAGAEVNNLKREIAEYTEQLDRTSNTQQRAGESGTDYAFRMTAVLNTQLSLKEAIEDTEFALTKSSFAGKLAEGIKTTTAVLSIFKDIYAETTTQTEASNEALDKWLDSVRKSTGALRLRNEAFGEGKAELVRLQGEEKKATTTSKKYKAEIDKVTKAKIAEIKANEKLVAGEKKLEAEYRNVISSLEDYYNALDPLREAELERDQLKADAIAALKAEKITQEQASDAILAANKIYSDAQAELQGFADKIRNADDVLEDLGFTNKKAAADMELLSVALAEAISAGDLEQAELYAAALLKISEAADRAAKSLTGIDAETGGLAGLEGVFQSILGNIGGELSTTLSDLGQAFVQNAQGPNGEAGTGVQNALGIGLAGLGGFLQAQQAGIDLTGSVLRGVQSALALIPGWGQAIAAIAEVVDQLAGGRLFGTAFETTGGLSSAFVGPDGGSGQSELFRERQRALFGGTQRETITNDLSNEVLAALESIFDAVELGVQNLASALGARVPEMIGAGFFQEFDAEGNLIREYSEILGRQFDETFADFGLRVLAENLIGVLDTVLPQVETVINNAFSDPGDVLGGLGNQVGEFEGDGIGPNTGSNSRLIGEATALAEQFRNAGASALLDFAQFASLAVADMQAGSQLLGTLTENLALIQDLQNPGEALVEAYLRVAGSVEVLDSALDFLNQELKLSRTEYVEFATAIAEEAGGLDRAAELWRGFFQNFYDPTELLAIQTTQAAGTSRDSLAEIGLGPNTSLDDFREAFESVFSSLGPAEVVQWLEAGEALNAYTELLAVQAEALGKFRDGLRSVNDDIQRLLGSDFQNSLANIESQEAETIRTLNELAIAAGRAGLSETELGRVHLRTALQTEQAIAQLRAATASLIDELYGDQIDSRIAELEALQASGINSVGNAAENTYERQLALIKRIRDVIDATRIDATLSTLTRQEQLAEGVAQFQELIEAARNGDTDALADLPSLFTELLGIGRDVFASGQGYEDLFNSLTSQLESLGVTASPGNPTVEMQPSPELAALYAERDARNAELETAHRLGLAAQLVEHLNQLASALNTPVLALAESMGANISDLVSDLGVNLEDITAETVGALADISNALGVELLELAGSLDLALGSLADSQSLLNDALEAEINALPEDFTALLAPLLLAVEEAADGKERDRALADLIEATANLPIEYRNGLAPFFDEIDPVTQLDEQLLIASRQEALLTDQNRVAELQLVSLQSINANLRAQNEGAGLNSFAVGTSYVARDQVANIHKGEMIITENDSNILRKYGIKQNSADDTRIVHAINQLTSLVGQVGLETNDNLENLEFRKNNRIQPNNIVLPSVENKKSCGGGF